MNRAEFQRLALLRLADARALLAARRWSAAYYLAGYAVECGLKACVLVRLAASPEILFEDRRFSEKCWTHSLAQLMDVAGLEDRFLADAAADPKLAQSWKDVKDWNETSRYERKTKPAAKLLYEAIADKKRGVMTWISRHW